MNGPAVWFCIQQEVKAALCGLHSVLPLQWLQFMRNFKPNLEPKVHPEDGTSYKWNTVVKLSYIWDPVIWKLSKCFQLALVKLTIFFSIILCRSFYTIRPTTMAFSYSKTIHYAIYNYMQVSWDSFDHWDMQVSWDIILIYINKMWWSRSVNLYVMKKYIISYAETEIFKKIFFFENIRSFWNILPTQAFHCNSLSGMCLFLPIRVTDLLPTNIINCGTSQLFWNVVKFKRSIVFFIKTIKFLCFNIWYAVLVLFSSKYAFTWFTKHHILFLYTFWTVYCLFATGIAYKIMWLTKKRVKKTLNIF